jgi:hypothetical protein
MMLGAMFCIKSTIIATQKTTNYLYFHIVFAIKKTNKL